METGCGLVRPLGATMLARNLGTRVAAGASPRPAYSDQATPPPPLGGAPPSTRQTGGWRGRRVPPKGEAGALRDGTTGRSPL